MSLFGYVSPRSIDEVVAYLASNPQARPLAGGHTLLLDANRSRIAGSVLVDLRKIDSLTRVQRLPDGSLKIGATTTIAALAESAIVREHAPALADAALLVGDAQVRNRATVAGNIAASDPGADLPPVLLVLNARIQILGPQGSREIAADEFFNASSALALGRDELIVSIVVPAIGERAGAAYEKLKHPATLFALCGVAAAVQVSPDGTVGDVRAAVTGASALPTRLSVVEQSLKGKPANEASLTAAARTEDGKLNLITDLFASAEYRGHLTRVLTERALKRAIATATA